jgi:hypothetical protein
VSGTAAKNGGQGKGGPSITGGIVGLAVAAFFLSNGPSMVRKYIDRVEDHDKLTKIHHQGSWSLGEYQDCGSVNMEKEDTDPELICGDASWLDPGKTFMVRFSGNLTYDKDKKDGLVLSWRCRNDGNAGVTFSCFAKQEKETKTGSSTESQSNRELTPGEIDDLRKRNECENRFTDKKVYEVDGMSLGAACKQNPDRRP